MLRSLALRFAKFLVRLGTAIGRRFASVDLPEPPPPPPPPADPEVVELGDITIYVYPEPDGRVVIDLPGDPMDEVTIFPDGSVSVVDDTGVRRTEYPEPDRRTVIEYPEPFKRTITIREEGITTEYDDPADGRSWTWYSDGSIRTYIDGGSVTVYLDGTGRYDPVPCDTVVSETVDDATGMRTQIWASGVKVVTTPGVGSHVIVPDELNHVPCPEHEPPPDPNHLA